MISTDQIRTAAVANHGRWLTLFSMTGNDLTREQVGRLTADVARQLRYLNHLCQRMQRLGFPPDDPLCQAALQARHAMQGLHVAAHYAGCKSGVAC